jgi:hypothetical protein
MKHQYFGDINDYRKYGLLRALQSSSLGGLLVAWMLTPDDGGPDGRSFAQRLVSELSRRTRAPVTHAFRTPHVLFLLAAQDRHAPHCEQLVSKVSERWKGQLESQMLASKPLQPTAFGGG